MSEHDDDLEREVHEDAEEETESFPDTADDLDGDAIGSDDAEEPEPLDDDPAEL